MREGATDDGITLTTFAREHVDPLLREAGARKKGRRYEFRNELGDVSFVDLFSRGWGNGTIGFDAGCHISPRSLVRFREWGLREQGYVGEPLTHLQYRLWGMGIAPPESTGTWGRWSFTDSASAVRCGGLLVEMISRSVIPIMTMSMDRHRLLGAIADDRGPIASSGRMVGTLERNRVLLLIDLGPSSELREALVALEESASSDPRLRSGDLEVLRWATAQLETDVPLAEPSENRAD